MWSITVSTLIFLAVIWFIRLLVKSIARLHRFKLVPGPRPRLPIIGNILEFYRPSVPNAELFHTVLTEMASKYRDNGLCGFFFGREFTLFIFDAQYATEFLNNSRLYKKPVFYKILKTWLGDSLLTVSDETWKIKRKLLNPSFSFTFLQSLIPTINKHSFKLIAKLHNACEEDFVEIMPLCREFTLNTLCEVAMGVERDEQSNDKEFFDITDRILTAMMSRAYSMLNWFDFIFYRRTVGQQLLKDFKIKHTFISNILSQRKKCLQAAFKPTKQLTFLDFLLQLQRDENSISDNEIIDHINTLVFGGHDTTSACLTWTLFLLGHHPETQQKLADEIRQIFGDDRQREVNKEDVRLMNFTECVIKESLRLYPPVFLFGRSTSNDCVIGGHRFPKGTAVYVCAGDIYRDAKIFPNPNNFIPERFQTENSHAFFAPFAIAPRNCIGQRFAMIEMKIMLANVFRNFRVTSLDKEKDVRKTIDIVMKPTTPVRMVFRPINNNFANTNY